MISTNFKEISHFDTFFGQSDVMPSFGPFGCQEPTYVSLDDHNLPSEALHIDESHTDDYSGLSKASKRIAKSDGSEAYLPAARRSQKKSNSARNPWTPREDAHLLELMSKYGQSWAMIASCLPGRTGKQVRDRFLNKLRPGVRCGDWSNAEDELVVRLMNQVGHRWSFIATHLPGRTEVQVKNRFYSHIKKRIQPNGVFCQTMSVSNTNSSQASSEVFSSSATSPRQEAVSFDFTQDFDFDIPTETTIEQTIEAPKNQTYIAKASYPFHLEIPTELPPTQHTSVASQSPVDATDMISYEFPVNEFCRQFSQPSLFKMTSFQLFHEAPLPCPQAGEAKRNVSSLEVEAERLSELTKRKAMLEKALAQTLQELGGSKC